MFVTMQNLSFRWDNGEAEKMSPWDLEPIDEGSKCCEFTVTKTPMFNRDMYFVQHPKALVTTPFFILSFAFLNPFQEQLMKMVDV